jgi:hypothetical protein
MTASTLITTYMNSLVRPDKKNRANLLREEKQNNQKTQVFSEELTGIIHARNGIGSQKRGRHQHTRPLSGAETCLSLDLSDKRMRNTSEDQLKLALKTINHYLTKSIAKEKSCQHRAEEATLVAVAMMLSLSTRVTNADKPELLFDKSFHLDEKLHRKQTKRLNQQLGLEDLKPYKPFTTRKHKSINMDLAIDANSLDFSHKDKHRKPFLLRRVHEFLDQSNQSYKMKPNECYKYRMLFKSSDLAVVTSTPRVSINTEKKKISMDLAIRKSNIKDVSARHNPNARPNSKPSLILEPTHKMKNHHSIFMLPSSNPGQSKISLQLSQSLLRSNLPGISDNQDHFLKLSIGKFDPKEAPLSKYNIITASNVYEKVKDIVNQQYRISDHYSSEEQENKHKLKINKKILSTLLINFMLDNIHHTHYNLLFDLAEKLASDIALTNSTNLNKSVFSSWKELIEKANSCFYLQAAEKSINSYLSQLRSHVKLTRSNSEHDVRSALNEYEATLTYQTRGITRSVIDYHFSDQPRQKQLLNRKLCRARLEILNATRIFIRKVPKRPNYIRLACWVTLGIVAVILAVKNKIMYNKFCVDRSESHAATMAKKASRLASNTPQIRSKMSACGGG